MHFDEQRKTALRLAKEAGAEKTLAVIKNLDACYETILKTAAEEIGFEKLVSILKKNEPVWAAQALNVFPDLGEHRATLLDAIPISGEISSIELYLASGAAFEAYFTMYWSRSDGSSPQPMTGTPDSSKWIWSQKLSISINRSAMMNCSDFSLPDSPLSPGDTVWMIVNTAAGNRFDTGFRFTYQPNAGLSRIDTWGVVTKPNFALHTGDMVTAA